MYRVWAQERSGGDSEGASVSGGPSAAELRRELHTALGTAKWQVNLSPLWPCRSFQGYIIARPDCCSPLAKFVTVLYCNWYILDTLMCKNFPCLNDHWPLSLA